jgi:hypothetical protein
MAHPGIAALLALALASGEEAPAPFRAGYLFNVSTTQGDARSSYARLAYDRWNDELYVMAPADPLVRVYNEAGMEVYRFGEEQGVFRAIAPLENGELLAIVLRDAGRLMVRCDFRGRPIENFELSGVPPSLGGFSPDALLYQNGKVYLFDPGGAKAVVADLTGKVVASYDLGKLLLDGKNLEENEIRGVGVDRNGNLLVTIPTQFRAYVVTPDGTARSFGQKGSRPGRFNIIGPIAGDDQGYLYVVDILRCVVIVFDSDFKFIAEFGGRGFKPGRLILPTEMVVGNGKVFVAQGRNRGVSVFGVR